MEQKLSGTWTNVYLQALDKFERSGEKKKKYTLRGKKAHGAFIF